MLKNLIGANKEMLLTPEGCVALCSGGTTEGLKNSGSEIECGTVGCAAETAKEVRSLCCVVKDESISDEARKVLPQSSKVYLGFVMDYQFDPVIHRMVDKHGWTEEAARECFEDTKRYLYLCVAGGKPIAPSKRIDEVWHAFILFTQDYEEFCLTRFGRFIHHRPRRRNEVMKEMTDTTTLARQVFGDSLSENWDSPRNNDDCGTCMSCSSCHGDG